MDYKALTKDTIATIEKSNGLEPHYKEYLLNVVSNYAKYMSKFDDEILLDWQYLRFEQNKWLERQSCVTLDKIIQTDNKKNNRHKPICKYPSMSGMHLGDIQKGNFPMDILSTEIYINRDKAYRLNNYMFKWYNYFTDTHKAVMQSNIKKHMKQYNEKFYIITAKLGHVGKNYYVPRPYVVLTSKNDLHIQVEGIRDSAGVKHTRKDAIISQVACPDIDVALQLYSLYEMDPMRYALNTRFNFMLYNRDEVKVREETNILCKDSTRNIKAAKQNAEWDDGYKPSYSYNFAKEARPGKMIRRTSIDYEEFEGLRGVKSKARNLSTKSYQANDGLGRMKRKAEYVNRGRKHKRYYDNHDDDDDFDGRS